MTKDKKLSLRDRMVADLADYDQVKVTDFWISPDKRSALLTVQPFKDGETVGDSIENVTVYGVDAFIEEGMDADDFIVAPYRLSKKGEYITNGKGNTRADLIGLKGE